MNLDAYIVHQQTVVICECCNDCMQGKAGYAPTAEELVLALRNHDLFLYFGHGSGKPYRYKDCSHHFAGSIY